MTYQRVSDDDSLKRNGVESEDTVLHNGSVHSSKNYKTVLLPPADKEVSPPSSVARKFCHHQKGNVFDHVTYFSLLSVASYVGVVCRIYLSELSHWDGVPIFISLYSQVVGTMVMGFMVAHKKALGEQHIFLYQAITTGLCGSITTFSAWNLEAMNSLLQTGSDPPDDVARVFGWATTLLLGMGMSSGALAIGKHLAVFSPWCDGRVCARQGTSNIVALTSEPGGCKGWHPGCKCRALLCLGLWLALTTVLVTGTGLVLNHWDLTFSMMFAALGTYIRWHLAPLNSVFQDFKLGTFLVNVLGSWLLGGVIVLQDIYSSGWGHSVLLSVGTGFCGCLTTVSTFAVELSVLKLRYAYLYTCVSILAAQIGLLLIIGPVQWTTSS